MNLWPRLSTDLCGDSAAIKLIPPPPISYTLGLTNSSPFIPSTSPYSRPIPLACSSRPLHWLSTFGTVYVAVFNAALALQRGVKFVRAHLGTPIMAVSVARVNARLRTPSLASGLSGRGDLMLAAHTRRIGQSGGSACTSGGTPTVRVRAWPITSVFTPELLDDIPPIIGGNHHPTGLRPSLP